MLHVAGVDRRRRDHGVGTAGRTGTGHPSDNDRRGTAEKSQSLHPYDVTIAEKVICRIERRFTNQAVRGIRSCRSAYQRRRLRRGRRVPVSSQRLQHPRRPRELQHPIVQARRSGVHCTAPVRPAGRS
jgi:hypothetical protein